MQFHLYWPLEVTHAQDVSTPDAAAAAAAAVAADVTAAASAVCCSFVLFPLLQFVGFRLLNSLQQLLQLLRRGCCREVYLLANPNPAAPCSSSSSSSSSSSGEILLRGIMDELSLVVRERVGCTYTPVLERMKQLHKSSSKVGDSSSNSSSSLSRCSCSSCSSCGCMLCALQQLGFRGEAFLLISDTKTRRQPTVPSLSQKQTAAIQLQVRSPAAAAAVSSFSLLCMSAAVTAAAAAASCCATLLCCTAFAPSDAAAAAAAKAVHVVVAAAAVL